MRDVVIVSAVRTAIGNFGGSLASMTAAELGTVVAKAAIERADINPSIIDEVIFGSVLTGGQGQNIARQVSILSGLDETIPAMTLGMVCGSGLRAVSLAAQTIRAGDNDVVLAGGTESMSNAVYALKKARFGMKMGHESLVDTMISDGLWDVFNDYHMGVTAENIAKKWQISREKQDEYAARSQQRAEAAISEGRFADEIISVSIPQRRGDPLFFDKDEFPRPGTTVEKLARLRPAFLPDGTVTAGNASGINDGAAALLVMSREKALELGLKPLAVIRSYASAGVDPAIMGTGVIPAARKAIKLAGITVDDLDLIEANEAFAAQALCVCEELGFDPEKTNVNGGAIALGHPIGASGARILVTLVHEMIKRDSALGLATLCIGGGMGTAVVVDREQ